MTRTYKMVNINVSIYMKTCPNCGSENVTPFFELRQVPVHDVLLIRTREDAVQFPRGDIELAFCNDCSFIYNMAFDPGLESYSSEYEETQGFSPTFNKFHHAMADRLIDRYNLHEKDIIEIGCGKGEFITMLCELGNNRGIGFDPTYINERNISSAKKNITFIKDFYSEKYRAYKADFICCKMTLEHIPDTAAFIRTLRNNIGDNLHTNVFFQIPDATRVFRDCAFWDIYYEHCSYFNPVSLEYLFRSNGFDVLDIRTEYDNQYLMIEAKPVSAKPDISLPSQDKIVQMKHIVTDFIKTYHDKIESWNKKVHDYRVNKQRVVIWGAGSKGVSFLTTLHINNEIPFGVDINPFKDGTYMVGTGQTIVQPGYLKAYNPDIVIIMNPIYVNEIKNQLAEMNLSPELVALT